MKSFIEAIVLIGEEQIRYVDFTNGVNIITGESKTGKSALVEIIDYCLCSSRCTIPKGIISDFTEIYSIILNVNDVKYLVARKNGREEMKKMYIENIKNFDIQEINLKYFEKKEFIEYKNVQDKMEKILGLQVSNLKESGNETKEKASLRHMTSYMFQHQNLMASKFALFYRFDDFQKKKDTILQFPVFAGIVNQEYYSTLMLLNQYKKELKRLMANEISNERIKLEIRDNLIDRFKNYYALIGQELDGNLKLEQLVMLYNNLPGPNENTYVSGDIVARYHLIKKEIDELIDQQIMIDDRIAKLASTDINSSEYTNSLLVLQDKALFSSGRSEVYTCPLCGGACNELEAIDKEVEEATSWLEKELQMTSLNAERFAEERRKLTESRDKISRKIKELYEHKEIIENKYMIENGHLDLQNKINYSKVQIQVYIETMIKGLFENQDEEISNLKLKIGDFEFKLKEFDLDKEIEHARLAINNNMNILKRKLDFEEEFQDYRLSFNFDEFELSLIGKNGQKVTLSEMGSGANWVSCHIALFLSLLRYFSERGPISPMPLIMFFDQPSQVYFPQGNNNSSTNEKNAEDEEAVSKMYKTIFEEMQSILEMVDVKAQLIIVDHVDYSVMKDEKIAKQFRKYTRRTWRTSENGRNALV